MRMNELATTNGDGHAGSLPMPTPGGGAGIEAMRDFLRTVDGRHYREEVSFSALLRQRICLQLRLEDALVREAFLMEFDRLQAELAGGDATPLERLLAERVAVCHAMVQMNELRGEPVDRVHVRLNSACTALARIRRLELPYLQVNIANQQVVNPT